MIRSIRTVTLLVGIDRTSSRNQFHCISSTYHTLTVTYFGHWAYKLTDEPVFVSEMYLCPCDMLHNIHSSGETCRFPLYGYMRYLSQAHCVLATSSFKPERV